MGKELFKNIPSKVGDLVKDVRNGRIGLPDLQRPFVWRLAMSSQVQQGVIKRLKREFPVKTFSRPHVQQGDRTVYI